MPFVLSPYPGVPNPIQYRILASGEIEGSASSHSGHPGQVQVGVGQNQNHSQGINPGQIMDFVHTHPHAHAHHFHVQQHHHGGALVAMTNSGPIGSGGGGGAGSGHGPFSVNAPQSGALVPVSNQLFNVNGNNGHHPSQQKVHQLCHGHGHFAAHAHFPSYLQQHHHHHHGHHGGAVIHHPSMAVGSGGLQQGQGGGGGGGQGQATLPAGLIHQSRYFSGTGFQLAASRHQNLQNQLQHQHQQQQLQQQQQQQQQNYYATCFPPLMAPPGQQQQQQQDHQGQGQRPLTFAEQHYHLSSSTSTSNVNSSSSSVKFANGNDNGTVSGSGTGGGGHGGRSSSRSSGKEKKGHQVKGHDNQKVKTHSSSGKVKTVKSATKVRDKAPRLVVSQKKKSVVNIGRNAGAGATKKLKTSTKVRVGGSISISPYGTPTTSGGYAGNGGGGSNAKAIPSPIGTMPNNSAVDARSIMGTIEGCLSSVSALTSVPFLHYPGQGQVDSGTCCGGQCQAEGSVGLPANFFEDFGAGDETVDFATVAAAVDADFACAPIMSLADICDCGPATRIEYDLDRMNPQMRQVAPPGFESLIRPAFPIELYDPSLLGNLVGNQVIRTAPLACFSSEEIDDVQELLDMISCCEEHAIEKIWMGKQSHLLEDDEDEASELSSDNDKENEDEKENVPKKEENGPNPEVAKVKVDVAVDTAEEIDQAEEDRKDWAALEKRFSRLLDDWTRELQFQRKMQQALVEINLHCCLQGEGQGQEKGQSQTLNNSLVKDEGPSPIPHPPAAESPESPWSTWFGAGGAGGRGASVCDSNSSSSGRASASGSGSTDSGTASGSASPDTNGRTNQSTQLREGKNYY